MSKPCGALPSCLGKVLAESRPIRVTLLKLSLNASLLLSQWTAKNTPRHAHHVAAHRTLASLRPPTVKHTQPHPNRENLPLLQWPSSEISCLLKTAGASAAAIYDAPFASTGVHTSAWSKSEKDKIFDYPRPPHGYRGSSTNAIHFVSSWSCRSDGLVVCKYVYCAFVMEIELGVCAEVSRFPSEQVCKEGRGKDEIGAGLVDIYALPAGFVVWYR